LGADLHGQLTATAQRGMAAQAVPGWLGRSCRQTDKHFGVTVSGVDRLDGVMAYAHLELKRFSNASRNAARALIDAMVPVACVADHGHRPAPTPRLLPRQLLQVDDFLNGRHRVAGYASNGQQMITTFGAPVEQGSMLQVAGSGQLFDQ
jgi:hypothetical protein